MKVIGMALMEATALGLGLDLEGKEWATLKANVEDSFWCVLLESGPTLHQSNPRTQGDEEYCLPTTSYGCSGNLVRRTQGLRLLDAT